MIKDLEFEIETPGAHLRSEQIIRLLGPMGPQEQYVLLPEDKSGPPAHEWDLKPYIGIKADTSKGPLWKFDAVDVKSTTKTTAHTFVMQIVDVDEIEDPNHIEITGWPHASGGHHGGGAHAKR